MSLAASIREYAGTGRFALSCTHPLPALARTLLDVWPKDESLPDVRCPSCLGKFRRVVKISVDNTRDDGTMVLWPNTKGHRP